MWTVCYVYVCVPSPRHHDLSRMCAHRAACIARPAFSRGNASLLPRDVRADYYLGSSPLVHGISEKTSKQTYDAKKITTFFSVRPPWNCARVRDVKIAFGERYLLSKIGYVSLVSTFNRAPYVFPRTPKFERCVTWHCLSFELDIFLK